MGRTCASALRRLTRAGSNGRLEYAFILEKRRPPGRRVSGWLGMHLTDLMGMEVRGMPLTALFTPEAQRSRSPP